MFRNREDAGVQLAAKLKGRSFRDPLVLAIPRGGVVIGAVLARELGAELDVVLTRKLRAPGQPELAVGAVSETGDVYLDPRAEEILEGQESYLAEEKQFQLDVIARRRKLFREDRPPAAVTGRSVIVTDDGIATGSTIIAALKVIRAQKPLELIVAVPVAHPERLEEVGRLCDDVVCPLRPERLWAISQFYADFKQVDDAVVLELLRAAAACRPSKEG